MDLFAQFRRRSARATSKTKTGVLYRQGDVLLRRIGAVPKSAVQQKREGDIILAYGEATGHAHRIATKKVVLWHAGTQRYITVEEPADLVHEEHGPIHLEPGVYEVIRQREWDLSGEWRQVRD